MRAAALVHDGLPFPTCHDRVGRWRRDAPTLPIVLYLPPEPGLADVILRAARIPRVYPLCQFDRREELERLVQHFQRWIGEAPVAEVRSIVMPLVSTLRSPASAFTEAALARIQAASEMVTVQEIAGDIGTSPRSLQRRFRPPHPPPHELLGWLLLFVVAATAAWHESDVYHGARALALRRDRFGRWATTLLGPRWPTDGRRFLLVCRTAFDDRVALATAGRTERRSSA